MFIQTYMKLNILSNNTSKCDKNKTIITRNLKPSVTRSHQPRT